MPTRKPDPVKYSSPDGGQTKYIENQRVADDLKKKGVKATAGKASGDRSKRMSKNRQYVERKRSSTPTKRTTTAGNNSQRAAQRPASPPLAQTFAQSGTSMPQRQPTSDYLRGPYMGNEPPRGNYGVNTPPGRVIEPASRGYGVNPGPQQSSPSQYRPMMPQYGFDAMPAGQPRPSAFSYPGVQQAAQGMQGMPPTGQSYIDQFMQQQGQMPQQFNPWGRRW